MSISDKDAKETKGTKDEEETQGKQWNDAQRGSPQRFSGSWERGYNFKDAMLKEKLFKVKYLPNKNIKNIIIRHYQKQGQKKDDIKSRYNMILFYSLYSMYVHIYETETPISLPPEFSKKKMRRKA